MSLKHIVLVHGGCHGAWCWETLVPLLEARGYLVDAMDLPGQGEDRTLPHESTLAANVDRVIRAIQAQPGQSLLVGHSLGGQTISQVAEEMPEKIGKLVYIAAVVPKSGESLGSFLEELAHSEDAIELRVWRPSSFEGAVEVDPAIAADILYNACDVAVAQRAVARLRPQAEALLEGKAKLSAARWGVIPKTYIVCTRDRIMPPVVQRQLCARLTGGRVHEMDTDHSPFYSDAQGLANILDSECH
jgi:pimeloyl-ACP methyl ester carboxylesterase